MKQSIRTEELKLQKYLKEKRKQEMIVKTPEQLARIEHLEKLKKMSPEQLKIYEKERKLKAWRVLRDRR